MTANDSETGSRPGNPSIAGSPAVVERLFDAAFVGHNKTASQVAQLIRAHGPVEGADLEQHQAPKAIRRDEAAGGAVA